MILPIFLNSLKIFLVSLIITSQPFTGASKAYAEHMIRICNMVTNIHIVEDYDFTLFSIFLHAQQRNFFPLLYIPPPL